MKTPISYYGGKQKMVSMLLPLIPKHDVYVEGFGGGLALFWSKDRNISKDEVINDYNAEVYNFWKVTQNNFGKLYKKIKNSIYSRQLVKETFEIYKNPKKYDPIERAFAFYIQTNMSFGNAIGHGFAWSKVRSQPRTYFRKVDLFNTKVMNRLRDVYIENDDIKTLIKNWDSENTFFYLDPPYIDTDQKFYPSYSEKDFIELLEILKNIKGKFLLSHYPNEILEKYIQENNWNLKINDKHHMTMIKSITKKKIEWMIYNYNI